MSDACFSVPTIALLTPIAAAIVAAVVALWRAGEKSHEREIAHCNESLDTCNSLLVDAHHRLNQGVPAMTEAKVALEGPAPGGRRRT